VVKTPHSNLKIPTFEIGGDMDHSAPVPTEHLTVHQMGGKVTDLLEVHLLERKGL
jgi:hypothetical protein